MLGLTTLLAQKRESEAGKGVRCLFFRRYANNNTFLTVYPQIQ